jgi:outer membrane protein OmpA-like peptidoglycan-associated protein
MIDPETSIVEAPLMATLLVKHPSCASSVDGSVQVSVHGGKPPYQFFWSHDRLFNKDIASDLQPGSYEVIISDYAGNEYVDVAQLTAPQAMQARIGEDANAEGFTLEVTASGGRGEYNYAWSNGNTSRKNAVQTAGTYTVTVTDANACSVVTSYALTEKVLTQATETEEPVPAEEVPLEAVTVENLKVLNVEKLNVGQILRIEQLQFKADSSHIEPESYAVLDGIYDFLVQNGEIVIEIGGHTNGLPDDAYCDRLSTSRAKSVAQYLTNKGIPDNRVVYHGYGKRLPVATNQTIEGRRKNQRVEVKILQM